MKTCKKCEQNVNIETVTCPNCEGHEFKLCAVKICSLCGKVNRKKNSKCELCGKSFSGKASDRVIATVMNLASHGETAKKLTTEKKEVNTNKTPRDRYIAIKGEIESTGTEDRCAFFIPGELKEKPIILLPSFQDSEKVDVYLVLANAEMPEGMKKIDISKEEDINALNTKKTPGRKTNIAAFVLFWLNLAIICAFGLKMVGEVMGFQIIVSSFGGNNAAGLSIINAMGGVFAIGSYAHIIYPIIFGLAVTEALIALIFVRTESIKGKKIFLIIMQSVVFVFIIGAYLISFLMIEGADWKDIKAGMILMAACGVAGVVVSIFYQYPKEIKHKTEEQKKVEKQEQSQASALGIS